MKSVIFLLLGLISFKISADEKKLYCIGKKENLKCLIEKWNEMKAVEPLRRDLLFATFGARVKDCSSKEFVRDYLSTASKIQASASFSEYYAEDVEKVIVQNPSCILDPASELSGKDQQAFLGLISEPVFTEPKILIEKITPFQNHKKMGNISRQLIEKLKKFEIKSQTLEKKDDN